MGITWVWLRIQIYEKYLVKRKRVEQEIDRLRQTVPTSSNGSSGMLNAFGIDPSSNNLSLAQVLKRPEVSFGKMLELTGATFGYEEDIIESVEVALKYEGYIHRQEQQVARFKKLEGRRIPMNFDYEGIKGFSNEVMEKLKKVRPSSIGQASRISGVTPAAISLLLVALERDQRSQGNLSTAAVS